MSLQVIRCRHCGKTPISPEGEWVHLRWEHKAIWEDGEETTILDGAGFCSWDCVEQYASAIKTKIWQKGKYVDAEGNELRTYD